MRRDPRRLAIAPLGWAVLVHSLFQLTWVDDFLMYTLEDDPMDPENHWSSRGPGCQGLC